MTRRVLDVEIRSEFKKGFGDIAKSFSALEKQLQNVSKLTASINKLATTMDRALTMKNAQTGLQKAATAQKTVNKAVEDGVRVAKQHESAYTKLGRGLSAVTTAQRAGSISAKQRMEAEVGLLNTYIKRTKDLSVLQGKKATFRDARGKFTSFSPDAKAAVQGMLPKPADIKPVVQKLTRETQRQIEAAIKDSNAHAERSSLNRGNTFFSRMFGNAGATLSSQDRSQLTSMYRGMFAEADKIAATAATRGNALGANAARLSQMGGKSTLGTQALVNRTVGVKAANADTGLMLGADANFNRLKLGYLAQEEKAFARLQTKAKTVSGSIRGMNFAPNPAKHEAAINKMISGYTRLGHVLFQLQYSTMTLFTATGLVAMTQQIDKFITLRNQVGRTSDSIHDLGVNMKDVYKISMRTFSDANVVGNMYSRINKYSKTLGLDQKQVGGVTEAISGAFAASPGNAQEKSASMYQFMQGFQSNRMGGDELRSVLEMAPFVGDILGKGLAKRRGMPEGSVVDLRQQGELGTPVNTRDLAAIFADPAIQAEIRKVLGEQARTFGDLIQVAKTRLMMLTEQFVNGTGIVGTFINSLSTFLGNDEKFAKFTDALETATIALVTYGVALGAKGAAGMAGSAMSKAGAMMGLGTSNLRNTMMRGVVPTNAMTMGPLQPAMVTAPGFMSNRAANAVRGQARNDGIRRALAPATNAIKGGAGAIANGASVALLGLGKSLEAVKKPAVLLPNVLGKVTGAYGKANTAMTLANNRMSASVGSVMAKGQLGSKALGMVGSAFSKLGTFIVPVIGFFTTLSIPLIAIAAVVALLAMRFNYLLGKMGGGMNIMDILLGLWDKLTGALSWVGTKVDQLTGGLFSGLGKAIDWVLSKLGQLAAEDGDMQKRRDSRMYGGVDGVPTIHVAGKGNFVATRNAQGQFIASSEEARNADGSWRTADFNAGQKGIKAFANADMNSGNKANLPETTNKKPKTPKGPKDPWPEFIRDLNLKIQAATDFENLTPLMKDIQSELNQNFRKAMDVMNFDSSGFSTLTEAWDAFSKTEASKAEAVNKLNVVLKNQKLADSFNEFMDSLNELFADSRLTAIKAGMNDFDATLMDTRVDLIKRYMDSSEFTGTKDDREEINSRLANGNVDGAERRLKGNYNSSRKDYDQDLARLSADQVTGAANGHKRSNALAATVLENQRQALSLFGNQRSVQEEINGIVESYVEKYGEANLQHEAINAKMREEIALAQARNQAQLDYNANWKNGISDSLAAYKDELANLASDVGNVFTNALSGIEAGLTSLITTGTMDLHGFITQIQGDIAKLFVRQMIMKPLTGWLEGMFGNMFGGQDQTIQAQNVYVNGNLMGGDLGGDLSSMIGGLGGGSSSGKKDWIGTAISWGTKLFGMFHGGGTVGASTMQRAVSPSVFAGARRYHTGGTAGMPALAVGEVPAILQRGEKVLTTSQYSAMNSGGNSSTFAPSIAVNYTAQGGNNEGKSGGEDHAKQVALMVRGAINEALVEYDRNSRKPGNPAYIANRR